MNEQLTAEAPVEIVEADHGDSRRRVAEAEPLQPRPDYFINREASWLAFNGRVLEEAYNPAHPLLERLRFLSISAGNLDEFYMVRVAGLKGLFHAGVATSNPDGISAGEQLATINQRVAEVVGTQIRCWHELTGLLRAQGVELLDVAELSEDEIGGLRRRFLDEALTVLTPIAVDPSHPFPFIPNRGMGVVFELERPKADPLIGLVLLPGQLERFQRLPGRRPALRPAGAGDRPLHRPAVPGLRGPVARQLPGPARQRDRDRRGGRGSRPAFRDPAEAAAARLGDPADGRLRHARALARLSGRPSRRVARGHVRGRRHPGARATPRTSSSRSAPTSCSRPSPRAFPSGSAISAAIASPPSATRTSSSTTPTRASTWWCSSCSRRRAIRPSSRSSRRSTGPARTRPIVAALIEAAEAGKSVTAMVELKARFDEERNIHWARNLERAGVQVVYGFFDSQDPRQGVDGGAARDRRLAHLRPFRDRQLSPDHRQDLHRPVLLHLRPGALPRCRQGCSTT